jgi:hypothetical protein
MAKDAYWFRHDANARNDIKIIELRSIHGYEGYGIYFAIIEVMREQTDYTISESKIGMVAVALGLPLDKLKPIMDDCISIGLFERRDGQILSQSLLNRMDTWDSYKNNGKKGGRPKKQPKDNQEDKPINNQKHNLNGNQKVKLNDTIIVDRVNRVNGVNKSITDTSGDDGESVALKIENAKGYKELIPIWNDYRKTKGAYMTLTEMDVISHQWEKKKLPTLKQEMLKAIENGWRSLVEVKESKEETVNHHAGYKPLV